MNQNQKIQTTFSTDLYIEICLIVSDIKHAERQTDVTSLSSFHELHTSSLHFINVDSSLRQSILCIKMYVIPSLPHERH